MSTPTAPEDGPQPPQLSPLLPTDPPKVGDYWLDARLVAAPSGVAFIGHDTVNTPVMLVLLSEGAAADAGARDRFAGAVNQLHIDTVLARGGHGQGDGRLGRRWVDDQNDDPQVTEQIPATPWVALAYDASPASAAEAARLLAEVDLSRVPLQGSPRGPDYRLHWIDRFRPGLAKLWPLPWPGRYDRAGWLSILASWLLMLLAALAVLIAILIFQQAPPVSPPPPVPNSASPQSGSPSPQSGSPSPQSGSPSPQSGSPSPQSGSPSPSPSSGSPSPGSASPSGAVGSPTPNSKL